RARAALGALQLVATWIEQHERSVEPAVDTSGSDFEQHVLAFFHIEAEKIERVGIDATVERRADGQVDGFVSRRVTRRVVCLIEHADSKRARIGKPEAALGPRFIRAWG